MNTDDEFIRSQVAPEHASIDAHAALASLKPAMRHARRRRHAALGAMTAALVGVGALGVVALNTATNSPNVRSSTQGEVLPTPDTNDDASTSTTLPATASSTRPADDESLVISATTPEDVNVTSVVTSPPTSTQRPVGSTEANTTVPRATPSPTRPRPAPTTTPPHTTVRTTIPNSTTTTSTARSTVPSTNPTTTTAPPPSNAGQRTIDSSCGSVTVAYSGDRVTLLSSVPNAGFAVDIKNSGPGEVEVRFERDDAKCEIKARMESGNLDISVDNDID